MLSVENNIDAGANSKKKTKHRVTVLVFDIVS